MQHADFYMPQSPRPEAASDEGELPAVQEITSATEIHGNFVLSDGLWDLDS